MRKILSILAFFTLFSLGLKAQQDYQVTHFMFDKLSINPAFAGINDKLCASAIFRNQWTGFGGEPKTGVFNVHAPVEILRGGAGLTVFNDKLGRFDNTYARLAYSYHLNILGGRLGIGASAGLASVGFDTNGYITPDEGEAATNDGLLQSLQTNDNAADFDFGLYYSGNDFYVGLSATHLSSPKLSEVGVDLKNHVYFMAGYEYRGLMDGDLDLKPNVLVKTDLVSTQFDVNVLAEYRKMIWGGVTYRHQDAIAPMVGYIHHLENESEGVIKIGYSYGITTSAINQYSSGTHEIALNYCMRILKPEIITKSKNPRFL